MSHSHVFLNYNSRHWNVFCDPVTSKIKTFVNLNLKNHFMNGKTAISKYSFGNLLAIWL